MGSKTKSNYDENHANYEKKQNQIAASEPDSKDIRKPIVNPCAQMSFILNT
jgi:hypothetical protein